MISPYQLLKESGFAQYTAMIRIHYNRDNTSLGAEKIAEMVRAIPGATRVSTVSLDKEHGIAIFNAKIISQKPPKEAYQALKQNALARYRGLITGLEVGANTIETKGDFIIKESNLKQSNLGNFIGQLLEEGLLLEVSIEELRRQFVECDPPKLTAEIFDQIVQACDNKSNYATWMCKKVSQGMINQEDFQLWHSVFEFFDRYKQRFEKKDINQVKTTEDINAFLTDYNRVQDDVEAKKATGQTQKVKDETDKCLLGNLKSSDGQEWLVYKTNPGQWALERKIGSGTSWCTVAQEHYFKHYMNSYHDPAYYIFINKKHPKEKYQIHYGSNQCKDRFDHEVDYGTEFVQDFYRYLEKVDNRTKWPINAQRGKEKLEKRKRIASELQEYPETLSHLPHEDVQGATLYELRGNSDPGGLANDDLLKRVAAIFRDLGDTLTTAVARAEEYGDRGFTGETTVILKTTSGWDLLFFKRNYYGQAEKLLSSIKNFTGPSLASITGLDDTLPFANEENFNAYKAAAKVFDAQIIPIVTARCDPNLPNLSDFKFKSEGKKTAYKLPEDPKTVKARVQTGINARYCEPDITLYVYSGPETGHKNYAVADKNGRWLQVPDFPGGNGGGSVAMNAKISILEFLGLELENNPSCAIWKSIGQEKGLVEDLKSSIIEVEGLPAEYEIGKSAVLKKVLLLREDAVGSVAFVCRKGEYDNLILADNTYLRHYKYRESISGSPAMTNQGEFRNCGIPVSVLVKLCQAVPMDIPIPLERLYARIRGEEGPTTANVTKTLRQQINNFEEFNIPLYRYSRGWRQGQVYSIEHVRGIHGTWEQLGPTIRESSPTQYNQIIQKLQANEGSRLDVFLYYYGNNNRSDWNGTVRLINADNKVIWYARRYSHGRGLNWTLRDVEPDQWTDAGNLNNNYVAAQPQQPRARRGQAAQGEQPAAAAPANINQEAVQEYKINAHNSEAVYRAAGQNARTLLQGFGFTNLAAGIGEEDQNISAVVYKIYPHRGNAQYAALLRGRYPNTVVAGLQNNPSWVGAAGSSAAWRALTRELDNSVRTFQQCHDLCQELHIPLPQAIQGWLLYRGQGAAQVAPNNQ